MGVTSIYGVQCVLPRAPQGKLIDNFPLPKSEQKFKRVEIPSIFDELRFDRDENPIYNEEHTKFINSELDRIFKDGYWFYNFGVPTYITPLHYFYLNYWTLEDGTRPEYRECDRLWFYYLQECEKRPYCYGIIRIKKRREGATSQTACWLYWKAIATQKTRCGIVSKKNSDAYDCFNYMIMAGFRNLPLFIKPRASDPESTTNLHFIKPKSKRSKVAGKGKLFDEDFGLDSTINYQATGLNSYDSGRLSALLIDEAGKWKPNIPVSRYWPIVKKTMTQGAKRVGFGVIPSTLNESEDGGAQFKKLWDAADTSKDKRSSNGLYRYFCPAYIGFPGYIDEYGHSIIVNPTKQQKAYMRLKMREAEEAGNPLDIDPEIGAREYLLRARENIKDDDLLNEEIRMNPFDEREAFMISGFHCYVNANKVYAQIEEVKERKLVFRKGRFVMKNPYDWKDGIDWKDDTSGPWDILALPDNPNAMIVVDSKIKPASTHLFCSGIDPFKSSITSGGKLSQGCIWIGRKLNIADPENTCMPVARYVGRPRLKSEFYREALMACIYFGCTNGYEIDAAGDVYDWHYEKNMLGYLAKIPASALKKDLTEAKYKNKKRTVGVQSGDAFALGVMLEALKVYVENHIHKVWWLDFLEELLIYDHEDRSPYDQTCAFMVLLAYMLGDSKPAEKSEPRMVPVLKTYNLFSKN